jgi:hypothetical protein
MAQSPTVTPNALARELSRNGRTVTAKMVRSEARSSIARFDKSRHPSYQSHEYTTSEAKALRAAFATRGTRKVKVTKATTTRKRAARKASTVAPSAE